MFIVGLIDNINLNRVMQKLNILILDDEKGFRDELHEFLRDNKYKPYSAGLPSEAFKILFKKRIDIIILDIRLPEMNGLIFLKKVKKLFPHIEVIMISGHGDMESVITAMRYGALDFFNKPFNLSDVKKSVEKVKNYIWVNKNLKVASNGYSLISNELEKLIGFPFIGNNPAMKTVINLINNVAKSSTTNVLITGESGTGKELVARSIHYLSKRKDNPFYSVNCSAIPSELFESEFFGNAKGAYTGAAKNKKGWFEAADNGTLFLDEIADLKLSLQPKLLRVLENKKISRIGELFERSVDVRIVAATNQNIQKLVENKSFRPDLFYRLNTFVINLPPLRERKDDIPLLVDYFIKKYTKKLNKNIESVDKIVLEYLMTYDFQGNVRELKNLIENAVIMCDEKILSINHFALLTQCVNEDFNKKTINGISYNLEQIERNTISLALQKSAYNKSKAAGLLEISRQALDRKLKKWNIDIHKTVNI